MVWKRKRIISFLISRTSSARSHRRAAAAAAGYGGGSRGSDLPPSHPPSKGSLAKCIQQYVTNPNYHSGDTRPLVALERLNVAREIPSDEVTFLDEIGEGNFGKVFKGKTSG